MDKVIDKTTGFHYTIVDNYILDSEVLNDREQIVYIHLKRYSVLGDKCFPGIPTLAKKLKCSPNKIRTHLESLENKGFISIKQRFNDSNEYTLLPYPEYLEQQETESQVVGTKNQKGIGDVLEAYQSNINPVYGSMERDELIKWYKTFENNADILIRAIEIAVYENVRKIKYINKILIDWHSNGVKTIEQVDAYTKQREENKKKKAVEQEETRPNAGAYKVIE